MASRAIIPCEDNEGEYTEEFKASLLRSLVDIEYKRSYTLQEIKTTVKL